ncbi:cyclic diguanylate phosphodiesterase [Enterobacterales bacterium CwR94]|nr:cyclic diguanylate phosphodiesterase [Enterobacterales bacterium CwR94]
MLKNTRLKGALLLLAAALLPLILSVAFSLFQAQKTVQRQLQANASILINQADSISDEAWNMVSRIRQLEGQPCEAIEQQLQRYGTLYAYFRSVGVTSADLITCSSAYGGEQAKLETMIRQPLPAMNKAWWSFSVAGTYGVPDRPAVLFYRRTPTGYGSYAVVEAQYLMDFMRAIYEQRGYQISMQFGDGYPISTQSGEIQAPSYLSPAPLKTQSTRYPIHVTVKSTGSEIADVWWQTFLTFLPMALILAVMLVGLLVTWLKRRMSFADDMRRAIAHGEFAVWYQPVYNIELGCCAGAEALMRWQRPNGEWVRPDVFIDAAEREGMIIPLTHHLLDLIARDAKNWTVPPGFHLGINVAAEHLQHPDFVSDIRDFAVRIAHLNATITLELTERSLIQDGEEVAKRLALLQQEGMRIAIDDFGTGHCALSYLEQFPLDYLKIDKGFVNTIESEHGETPVLEAIISLSHRLKLEVLAEGVESAMQYRWLREHGVSFIQGYLYARPMPNADLMRWMTSYGHVAPDDMSLHGSTNRAGIVINT